MPVTCMYNQMGRIHVLIVLPGQGWFCRLKLVCLTMDDMSAKVVTHRGKIEKRTPWTVDVYPDASKGNISLHQIREALGTLVPSAAALKSTAYVNGVLHLSFESVETECVMSVDSTTTERLVER